MKKYTIFLFCLILAAALCGCRQHADLLTTTAPTTRPPITTAPATSAPELTMETNIPDPSVDDSHLVETTVPEGTAGTAAAIRGRIS